MNRRKKLYFNTLTALVLQIITFVCGFILPKYILLYFGSDINGLITSITRFLSVISFLELGIGPVIQSNLYKPLADKDEKAINEILVSSERFYKIISYIFLSYIVFLIILFPKFNPEYNLLFSASLIVIIAISTFAQYYFGITFQVLLNADQKVYIVSIIQIITLVINTFVSVILIKKGCNIFVVKLASSIVFVIRPLFLNYYVKKTYNLNLNVTYVDEPIKQKWNGFAQHVASVVTEEIDIILLTIFVGYKSVSIYSIYFLVANGVTKIVMMAVSGLESFWGNMIANKENRLLENTFELVECMTHLLITFIYCSTAILISPFVLIYVKGSPDIIDYYVPVFGVLLTAAYGIQCLRIPYFRIIKAAGHYKETQNGSFIAMFINIIVSIILVLRFGLLGVSIGTLMAMIFHTLYFVFYLRKHIIFRSLKHFFKHVLIDFLSIYIILSLSKHISLTDLTYVDWVVYAIKISMISVSIILPFNCIVFGKRFVQLVKQFN